MSDELLLLEDGLHVNSFKRMFKLTDEILENFEVDPSGNLLAVKESKVKDYFEDPEVADARLDFKTFKSQNKAIPLKTEEDFYRIVAMHVYL